MKFYLGILFAVVLCVPTLARAAERSSASAHSSSRSVAPTPRSAAPAYRAQQHTATSHSLTVRNGAPLHLSGGYRYHGYYPGFGYRYYVPSIGFQYYAAPLALAEVDVTADVGEAVSVDAAPLAALPPPPVYVRPRVLAPLLPQVYIGPPYYGRGYYGGYYGRRYY